MSLTFAEYLKLKQMEPGSKDAVYMGCTCAEKIIDPHCPFHWHLASQAYLIAMFEKIRQTEKFNNALRFGYLILGLGMTAVVLYKF